MLLSVVAIPRYVETVPEAAARVAGYIFGDGNPDVHDNQLNGLAFTFIGSAEFQTECRRCAVVCNWTSGVQWRVANNGNFKVRRDALYGSLGITSPTHDMYHRALEPTLTYTPTRVQVQAFLASVIETEGSPNTSPPKVFDDARGGEYDQRIDALVLTLNTQSLGAFRSGVACKCNLDALDAFPLPLINESRYPGGTPADWPEGEIPIPDTTPPATPTGLIAVPGNTNVALSWNDNTESDLAGYLLRRDGLQIFGGTETSYLDTGLVNGTTYTYTIAATDDDGNVSAYSTGTPGTPVAPIIPGDTTPPDMPTNLTGTPGSTQVSLSWTASVASDLASYRVYRASTLIATVAAPSTFYVDENRNPDTVYTYRLTAVDTAGNESNSTTFISVTTLGEVPEPPPITVGPFTVTSVLGCARTYEVFVADRSGTSLLRSLPFTGLRWQRVMDDVSRATVRLDLSNGPYARECCRAVADLLRWGYEIVVYRDGLRVWTGPVVDIIYDRQDVVIEAEDKMAWLKVRPIWTELIYPEPGEDAAVVFNDVINNAMAPDNVPGLVPTAIATGIRAVREFTTQPPILAYDAIQELARTGVDYTMFGPTMVAGSFVVPTPPIAFLTEQSIVEIPRIEYLGSNVATQWFVTGDPEQNLLATYGGVDPTVGLVVRLAQEDEINDQASLTQNAKTRWELTSATSVGNVTLQLDPAAPLPLDLAVPGAVVDLRLTDTCAPLIGSFRMREINFDMSGGDAYSETVTALFEPVGTEIVD